VLTSELEVFIFEEVIHEDGGVNRIGFGALALGAGEVADASGFDDGHGGGGVEGAHHGSFVTAGGFANNLRFGDKGAEV
jgi:hypothetical protein